MTAAALGRIAVPALLLFGALVHYAPEHLAGRFGGLVGAWETVAFSAEAIALWLAVAMSARALWPHPAVWGVARVVAAWYATQGFMRGGCRLFFDMAKPLHLPQPMCVAAFGEWFAWMDVAGTCAVAALVAGEVSRGRR
jgi:hypothetical protein